MCCSTPTTYLKLTVPNFPFQSSHRRHSICGPSRQLRLRFLRRRPPSPRLLRLMVPWTLRTRLSCSTRSQLFMSTGRSATLLRHRSTSSQRTRTPSSPPALQRRNLPLKPRPTESPSTENATTKTPEAMSSLQWAEVQARTTCFG